MKATVLLGLASACLRMGCQVERATDALEAARSEARQRQIESEWADAQERGNLHSQIWRLHSENADLKEDRATMRQVLDVLAIELQELEAAEEAAAPTAIVPCVDPS